MSPICSTTRFFIPSLSGPIDEPSPKSRPRQHVDEAGRDRLPGRVDDRARLRGAEVTDAGDAVAADGDVGPPSWSAAAVVDRAAADDDVVGLWLPRRG
jgi:hypothetical protein